MGKVVAVLIFSCVVLVSGCGTDSTLSGVGSGMGGGNTAMGSARASSGGQANSAAGGLSISGGSANSATGGLSAVAGPQHYFPAGNPWTIDVSNAAMDPDSGAIITWLNQQGFGTGQMRIDFTIDVLIADASTPKRDFQPTDDFYSPDCDQVPVPVPVGGNLEGETGYACTTDGDCHLLVVDQPASKLYEMWRANIVGPDFFGGCLAVWDLGRVYGPTGRGEQCTSADAAGYPIAPLLFTADEVKAGAIEHAIRFILPNASIRSGEYVHPATHSTSAASGPKTAPPYGARLRLRADFPLASLPSDGARVVARGLQKYGMLLADGGNIALTAQTDRHTQAKWDGLLGSHDLVSITPGDFEVIALGTPLALTNDCLRSP